MASSNLLITLVPILSDIFVFTYPIYLVYLYFTNDNTAKRWILSLSKADNLQNKYQALTLFSAFIWSVIVNYIIKFFVEESRPYHSINLSINPEEASRILNIIPVDSFPSDHAAVGVTIAVSLIIIAYQTQNKNKAIIWRTFFVFAMIMNVSRITMWLHRPTDILAGSIIWIIVAIIMTRQGTQDILWNYIFNPIVNLQERIFSVVQKKSS